MASKTTGRSLQSIARTAQRGCSCSSTSIAPIRHFSSSASRPDVPYETDQAQRPRWSYTPERMKAPFPAQPKNPDMAWECNNDPAKLDQFYEKFLGRGGDIVLTEEIKWLAITHKSFDQGRRGFNDRLAFFGMSSIPTSPCLPPFLSSHHTIPYQHHFLTITGRRILNLQVTLSVLHSPLSTATQFPPETSISANPNPNDRRKPFTHPSLALLQNLSSIPPSAVLTKRRLATLATHLGLRDVMRWKPRMPGNLDGSGIDVVLTTSMYAIIGAVALQRGSEVAGQVARERVLQPLGIE